MVLKSCLRHRWVTRGWSERTLSFRGTIKSIFLNKNWNEINEFLAILEKNFGFKIEFMVFSTCESTGGIFGTLRQRLQRNCRARQIGHVGVTFPIGRLGVKYCSHCGWSLENVLVFICHILTSFWIFGFNQLTYFSNYWNLVNKAIYGNLVKIFSFSEK